MEKFGGPCLLHQTENIQVRVQWYKIDFIAILFGSCTNISLSADKGILQNRS